MHNTHIYSRLHNLVVLGHHSCSTGPPIPVQLGRVRDKKWGQRIIDIDVLSYGEKSIALDGLMIPHPRMAERSFVLIPLAEFWPEAKINGLTVLEAKNLLNDLDDIQLLND